MPGLVDEREVGDHLRQLLVAVFPAPPVLERTRPAEVLHSRSVIEERTKRELVAPRMNIHERSEGVVERQHTGVHLFKDKGRHKRLGHARNLEAVLSAHGGLVIQIRDPDRGDPGFVPGKSHRCGDSWRLMLCVLDLKGSLESLLECFVERWGRKRGSGGGGGSGGHPARESVRLRRSIDERRSRFMFVYLVPVL